MTITAVFETIEELKTFAESILGAGPIKNPVCSMEVNGDNQRKTMQDKEPQQQQTVVAPVTQTTPAPQTAPASQPVPTPQTVTQAPVQQAAPVPTAAPAYTLDDLARAAMPLIDSGRQAELQQLLAQFGTEALPALPPVQYGAFATALRGLGAQI